MIKKVKINKKLTEDDINEKFGFFVESLKYGKEIKSGSGTMNDPFVIE